MTDAPARELVALTIATHFGVAIAAAGSLQAMTAASTETCVQIPSLRTLP